MISRTTLTDSVVKEINQRSTLGGYMRYATAVAVAFFVIGIIIGLAIPGALLISFFLPGFCLAAVHEYDAHRRTTAVIYNKVTISASFLG